MNFMSNNNYITKLYLNNNGLKDVQLAHIIAGLNYQMPFTHLIIQDSNVVDMESVEQILNLTKRKIPENL